MIELQNICKAFDTVSGSVEAVKDVSLKIEKGDIFGIIGLSGAGKSTLVRCINLLEKPTSGKVLFKGAELSSLSRKELLKARHSISMIFQGFNLLEQRTALKNVCFPMEITGVSKKAALQRAKELLQIVDLGDRMNSYPSQLSGGQKQRVAIARALASNPEVLLCDEATSALDPKTTHSILELLQNINKNLGVTIVVITHEMKVVEQICNKVAVLDGGSVVESGDVREVFLSPKSQMAKTLILPQGNDITKNMSSRTIRVAFDGQESSEPVISNLSLECHTAVNIMGADTKNIGGKAYGQMLLQLPDDEASVTRIFKYLSDRGIKFEEVSDGE